MLSLRDFIGVSGGVSLLLISSLGAMAQPSDAPASSPLIDPIEPRFNVEPSQGAKTIQPLPEAIDPSANPLFFPTRPPEVDVTRVNPVTLDQALAIALQNNTTLKTARLQLEERQAQLENARALLFPTIDFNTQFDRQRSQGAQATNIRNLQRLRRNQQIFTETTEVNEETTNVSGQFELNYNIYQGGERAARIQRAEKEVQQQQLEVERVLEQLRADVTQSYYDLQNADAQVAIAQAAVEDTTQSLRDAQLLENAGLGTRFDTLRAEVDLARANQGLTTAIGNQRTARRQLVTVLNVNQHAEFTAADEISESGLWPLTLEETIVQAYKNRAELEQQIVQREISEQDREIALAGIRPMVRFFANWGFSDDFDDPIPVTNGYIFGTSLQWRLFDGGQAFAQERAANRNIDIADTNFANQLDQIRFEVEEAYFSMISNRENIGTTRRNVELAEESLRLARLRFQAGVGTQTDVINSQRDLTDARSEFLQAIINYNQSLNDLQRAVSNLPDNRLFEKP